MILTSMINGTPSRMQWIDTLRAFAVFLVIWGHIWSKGNTLFFVIANPVKIPLFFAISGYLFNAKKTWRQFVKTTFFHLIIPWFFLSLIWLKISYALIIGYPNEAWISLYNFISGKTHWYMPCCIIAITIHFCITKCFPYNRNVQFMLFIVIAIIGFLLGYYKIVHFAMFDIACLAQAYLLLGRLLQEYKEKLDKGQHVWIGIILYFMLILLSLFLFPGKSMDVHQQRYYNLPICIALVTIGITTLFVLAAKRNTYPRWICYIGENTLIFYILHYYVKSTLRFILNKTGITIPTGIIAYTAEFVIVIAILFALSWVINHFFPFALGKPITKTRKMEG